MRVNIWIPDDLVDEIREYAHKAKESVSGYLVGLHRANMGYRDSAKPEDAIPMKKIAIPADFVDPLAKGTIKSAAIARGRVNLGKGDPVAAMAAAMNKVVEEKITSHDKHFFNPMPKVGKVKK